MALYQKKNGMLTKINAEGFLDLFIMMCPFCGEDTAHRPDGSCAVCGKTMDEQAKALKPNADTVPMDKDDLVKEHEDLTGLLGKTAEELEAEKAKQEKELGEIKAKKNDAVDIKQLVAEGKGVSEIMRALGKDPTDTGSEEFKKVDAAIKAWYEENTSR